MKSLGRFFAGLCLLVVGVSGVFAQALWHETDRLKFGIFGQGFLASDIINGQIIEPNFFYPATDANPRPLLENYSEIWVGTDTPPIASALDATNSGLGFGEWTVAANGLPEDISSGPSVQIIRTAYEAQPSDVNLLPFHVLVEQTTYTWKDGARPESNGIVFQLTLTNQLDIPIEGLRVAFATNWDIDPQIVDQGKPSKDLVEWDEGRRASIAFKGQPEPGETPLHAATVLLQGDLFAHRILAVPQTPWTFADAVRAQALGPERIDPLAIVPNNYMTFVIAGPIRLEGKNPVTLLFALVGGESRTDLETNLDAIAEAVAAPADLAAEVTDAGIHLSWQAPIRTDLFGYAVFRATEEAGDYEQVGPRIVETREFTDVEVEPGVTYYYRVHPVDASETILDASTETISVKTAPKPPTLRVRLANVAGTLDQPEVVLAVEPPVGVDLGTFTLQLLRNETGEPPFTVIQEAPFTDRLTDHEVAPGKRYFYAVRLLHESGRRGDLSEAIEVNIPFEDTTPLPTLERVRVGPNPVYRSRGDRLRFMNLPAPVAIFIYTPTGERVARLEAWTKTYEWAPDANLASGVYLYQMEWVPEARSKDADSAPRDRDVVRVSGKFVLMD